MNVSLHVSSVSVCLSVFADSSLKLLLMLALETKFASYIWAAFFLLLQVFRVHSLA